MHRGFFATSVGMIAALISVGPGLLGPMLAAANDDTLPSRTWSDYVPLAYNSETDYIEFLEREEILDRNGEREPVLAFIARQRPIAAAQKQKLNDALAEARTQQKRLDLKALRDDATLVRDAFWQELEPLISDADLTRLKVDFVRNHLILCIQGDPGFQTLVGLNETRVTDLVHQFNEAAELDATAGLNRDPVVYFMGLLNDQELAALRDLGVWPLASN